MRHSPRPGPRTKQILCDQHQHTDDRLAAHRLGHQGPGRVEAAFGPDKFERLQVLEDEWDPTNVFRHNRNIPPTSS